MNETIKATARIERDGRPVLFFHCADGEGFTTTYSHSDQHSEASATYFRECTRPVRTDAERTAVDALVREWNGQPGVSVTQILVRMSWRAV